jgi:uncharacterized spore protein YtfJ
MPRIAEVTEKMNGVVLRLLRSPLHRVLDRHVCALRFRGRVTGRIVELPVEYVRSGRQLVVLAGDGAHKTWWRNFRHGPHRVDAYLDGHWYAGTGTALLDGDPARTTALARYRAAHRTVPADTADPVVVIELGQAPPTAEVNGTARRFLVKIDELLSKATDPLEARMVYAEPIEKDGITVIAAARLAGGGGGGSGHDEHGQEGEGGGLGLTARPAGAYVIKDGKLRWEPAVDVNRLVATVGAVTVAIMLVAARIVRIRAHAAS